MKSIIAVALLATSAIAQTPKPAEQPPAMSRDTQLKYETLGRELQQVAKDYDLVNESYKKDAPGWHLRATDLLPEKDAPPTPPLPEKDHPQPAKR